MATVPFVFSVGDFIATIALVKDIVKVLNDTKGAMPAYQCLGAELITFDDALTRIQGLDVDATKGPQKAALQAVAAQVSRQHQPVPDEELKVRTSP